MSTNDLLRYILAATTHAEARARYASLTTQEKGALRPHRPQIARHIGQLQIRERDAARAARRAA